MGVRKWDSGLPCGCVPDAVVAHPCCRVGAVACAQAGDRGPKATTTRGEGVRFRLDLSPATPVRALLHQVRRVANRRLARRFVALAVVSVLVSFLDIAGIAMLVPLVDDLAGDAGAGPISIPLVSDFSTGALLGLAVGFFVAKSLCMAGLRWWAVGAIQDSAADTATRLFAAYMRAPMTFHDERNSATSVGAVVNTVRILFDIGFTSAASGVAEAATLVVLGCFIFVIAPLPAVAGAAYLGVAAWLFLRVIQPRTRRAAQRQQELVADAVQSVNEGLGGLREHRVRMSESGLIARFQMQRMRQASAQRFVVFAAELPRYFLEVLLLGGFGVVAFVVLSSNSGPDSLGVLAVLLAVALRLLPSMSRLLAAATSLRSGEAALEVITTDLDAMGISRLTSVRIEPPSADAGHGFRGGSRATSLGLRTVTFRYDSAESPALSGVSFDVPAGTSLGVVGPSGAGKSTLIDVVCGLRPLGAGELLIDGDPVDWADRDRRARVGLVPQDVYLVDGSIARNVAFGSIEDSQHLWEVLEMAQLAEFVRSLPGGIETVVGERGTRLSGGQRQRIGIARALYGRPGVLVLDEATSALDGETETAIVEAVRALSGELTVVVVAHRLSTIRHCDQIVYLEDGQVEASGTFEEVVEALPRFARAVEIAGMQT